MEVLEVSDRRRVAGMMIECCLGQSLMLGSEIVVEVSRISGQTVQLSIQPQVGFRYNAASWR